MRFPFWFLALITVTLCIRALNRPATTLKLFETPQFASTVTRQPHLWRLLVLTKSQKDLATTLSSMNLPYLTVCCDCEYDFVYDVMMFCACSSLLRWCWAVKLFPSQFICEVHVSLFHVALLFLLIVMLTEWAASMAVLRFRLLPVLPHRHLHIH